MFDVAALDAALAGTMYAGKLHFSSVTGSTNTDAQVAARAGSPHGSVYFADEQRAGRGRGNHAWHSAAGEGLYVSVLLRPHLPAARLLLLPLAAGLAAVEAIRTASGLATDLRWPNDLLLSTHRTKTSPWGPQVGPRKAGGILAEAQTEAGRIVFAVVGIGINVHQRSFDSDMATPATSLDLESGRWVSRQELLVALLESLERETRALADPGAGETIPSRVEAVSSWVSGRRVEVHGPQACTGITEGLDEHGFLRVRTADGLVQVQTGGIREAATSH